MIETAILNVTGYAGFSAALLLQGHPEFTLRAVSGRGEAGKRLKEVFPWWAGPDLRIEESAPAVDLVLCGLPHSAAAAAIAPLHAAGSRVVDISADLRLHDQALYTRWYGEHGAPELLAGSVYGLPELHREEIAASRLVGNPGCYPTAAILALAPALREGIVELDVVVDAKSGISGGGRGLTLTNHYSEVNESVSAYGLRGHRHLPEIEQELSEVAGEPVGVVFTPHLAPMTRGLLATCYARLRRPLSQEAVLELYKSYYEDAQCTRVLDTAPATKWTSGTNVCLVYPSISPSGSHLVALAAIDNLIKGASGQAIQNANLMFGLPETMGLPMAPQYP